MLLLLQGYFFLICWALTNGNVGLYTGYSCTGVSLFFETLPRFQEG